MASPNISVITASQGTGASVQESVVEIEVTFTADHNCNFVVEISLDNGSTWDDAVMHSEGNGQNLAPAADVPMLVDVNATFQQVGFPSRGAFAQAKVRVQATDTTSSATSSVVTSDAFALKSTLPVVTSVTMSDFVGAADASSASVVFVAQNGDGSTAPAVFRANLSAGELEAGSELAFESYGSGDVSFAFSSGALDGSQTVFFRVYDGFYNASDTASTTVWLQRTPPANCVARITGSVGNSDYTGIAIADDGSFTVDRSVVVAMRATSDLELTFMILPSSDVEEAANVNSEIDLDADNAVQTLYLTTNPANPTASNFNTDANTIVRVRFTDQAGNTTTISSQIRLNTRLYQAAYFPMRTSDASYQAVLREVSSSGAETVIGRTITLSEDPIRLWGDIFYPATHSYPTIGDGELDDDAAITMDGVSTSDFDAPTIALGQVVLDSEGRPVIAASAWTSDGTKNYGHMVSARQTNRQYWVLDTTGHGEYQLDFEHFNLDTNTFGPPFNTAAPYRGDVLVIYDATESGALVEEIDDFGVSSLVIGDSTKLRELFAFTGSGTNVVDLTTGIRTNSGPAGNFITDYLRGLPKIVLMFFSDVAGSSSGFRLKSSPAFDRTWVNYHVDETTGKVWVHKHSSLGSASGAADATAKRMVYDYLTNPVQIDYDTGTVTFGVQPSGIDSEDPVVEVDYSYHGYSVAPSGAWIASNDDFVQYADAALYVGPSGVVPSTSDKERVFETDGDRGRVSTGYTWDKDRGVVEIDSDHVPASGHRLYADYQHHTYTRLSNDGYGDLTWRDSVVVADVTPLYPDYTFTSVKIVNEGDAMLENAKFKFVPRGYDTNNDGQVVIAEGSVDSVLDVNRPWDIQRGTRLETYDKMAMQIDANYLWTRSMAKADAMTILGVWKDKVYGDIAARSRVFGRAVWVLGGSGGSSYPTTSAGRKRTSLEATGRFYSALVVG